MTNYFCPDCTWVPVPPPRRGKDGRCQHCRAQLGRQLGEVQPWRGYDHDELLIRLGRAR